MYDILKPSVFWKIWQKWSPYFISEGGSDGLNPALFNRILHVGEHICPPADFVKINFKQKIILPWCNLTLPKNVLRIN